MENGNGNGNGKCKSVFCIFFLQVENKKEALSKETEDWLLKQPTAVLKNLSNVLRLDLSLFSTKTLVETAPDHQIEVRTQKRQRSEDNFDHTNSERIWKCESVRNYSTVVKYGMYQAQDFQKALQVSGLILWYD